MLRTSMTLLAILLVLASPVMAKKRYGAVDVDQVVSIYDADTIYVDIHAWPAVVGERMPVRLRDLDAPELRGKCSSERAAAQRAKQATVAFLRGAQRVELRELGRDKFFRLDADVYADGKSLKEHLVAGGFVRPYDGGPREGWCSRDKAQ